jgi:hypothetical protein
LFENQLVFVLYLGLVVLCSLLIKEMSNINLTPSRTKKDLEQISEQTIYARAQTTAKDRRSLRSSTETIPSSEPPRLSSQDKRNRDGKLSQSSSSSSKDGLSPTWKAEAYPRRIMNPRGEALLHRTYYTQRELQEKRTRDRIQQLYDAEDNTSAELQEINAETPGMGRREAHQSDVNDDEVFVVPSTNMRLNITQRRSQGRAKDRESIGSTSMPIHELLTRKSNPREKDALYKQEVAKSPKYVNEALPRTPTAPIIIQSAEDFPMNVGYDRSTSILTTTAGDFHPNVGYDRAEDASNKSNHLPDFTRHLIPSLGEDPILHKKLKAIWMRKKGIEEDMQEALADEVRYLSLKNQRSTINAEMFEVLQNGSTPQYETVSSEEEDDACITPPQPYEDQDDSPSTTDLSDESQSTASGPGGIDWCYDGSSYLINLKFPEDEDLVPWVVWSHMPISLLIIAAIGVLTERGHSVSRHEITLVCRGTVLDATFGRLSDHPILANAVVDVCVTQPRGGQNTRLGRQSTRTGMDSPNPSSSTSSVSSSSTSESRNRPAGNHYRGPGYRDNFPSPNRPAGNHNLGPGPRYRANVHQPGGNLSNGGHPNPGGNPEQVRRMMDEEKGDSKSLEKLKQAFKCPRFSGNAKDWKTWDKGFQRYLAIWDLDHILDPSFFTDAPLSDRKLKENKIVYYLLEDATQGSPLAASYVRQAPIQNGFEAYYTLHDGFVFAGATTSTLLLNELSNFRFQQDESPTALIMRLEELFQDMEMLPDGAAMKFNDTQRINYLLGALRHEPEWATVTSYITSCQLKGEMTFRLACNELKLRCEASKAYKIMDKEVKGKKKVGGYKAQVQIEETGNDEESLVDELKALVSTVSKRLNRGNKQDGTKVPKKIYEKHECLVKECSELTTFSLCKLHYLSLVSGKAASLELRKDWGHATYDEATKQIVYPPKVPAELKPAPKVRPKAQ